jgi:diguanylate cyclase (GGDEF)-like protein
MRRRPSLSVLPNRQSVAVWLRLATSILEELNANLISTPLRDPMSAHGPGNYSTTAESCVEMSAIVLCISQDRDLMKRLVYSCSAFDRDTLTILCVDRLSEATQRLRPNDCIDAVILDWDLPARQGLEALLVLLGAAPHLPIIVLGGDPNLAQQMNLIEHAAQDHLLERRTNTDAVICIVHGAIARKSREMISCGDKKPAETRSSSIGDTIRSTDAKSRGGFFGPVANKPTEGINIGAAEHLVRPDGNRSSIEDTAAPSDDRGDYMAGVGAAFHDISEARAKGARMTHLAEHDILTSLPNRPLATHRLDQGVAIAQRHGRRLAVLLIDLDYFRHVNDSVGYRIGDLLLSAVALRIKTCVRSSDTVSREVGDEFIVLLSEISRVEDAALIAEKIRLAILRPYTIASHHLHLTTSIGISLYPEDSADPGALIRGAHRAMYRAKETGGNKIQFLKQEGNVHTAEREIITRDLRHALKRDEFMLEYQPKVNLINGTITGVEALLRWRHPSRGVLLPVHFIQIAEDCGLIVQIGQWALRAACVQAQAWLAAGYKLGTMAVNISAAEFHNVGFFDSVCRTLRSTGLAPRYLELELTETAVMRNPEETSTVLQSLSAIGARIAVDDFVTGYSNLSYLRRFPINTLKLDRSLLHDIPESQTMATIVGSVIHMGQSLHLQVVAEGVENARQLKFLQAHDCAEGQGFYFSQPVGSAECQALISRGARLQSRKLSVPTLRAIK